ncbi:Fe-S protein assembly co-chaperone HscB [Noviherbaspirillum aridicola]|uniref:Co-chaperone protein HscB homolog n=1 Tax=Noviherbaspirillum aridicola TaxID=2849687 RepID=A0ABQ4Q8M9_9BURK|nr:Fe-S protein assembly co-chaperone HscB [Noviherbaspirillum aridicola]GIZ53568.1 co-chaperone protein HscB [Noviherbaspirillum aridicola]
MQNHFELFHLPQRFAVDMKALEAAYREVQSRVHPDKFTTGTDSEKRVALQWAARANEAYQTLKNPFRRAAYLCELNGVDLQIESNTAMPTAFLMQQMEWREALDEARDAGDVQALDRLDKDLQAARKAKVAEIGALLDSNEYDDAGKLVRQLMFLDKLDEEVQSVFEKLEG